MLYMGTTRSVKHTELATLKRDECQENRQTRFCLLGVTPSFYGAPRLRSPTLLVPHPKLTFKKIWWLINRMNNPLAYSTVGANEK